MPDFRTYDAGPARKSEFFEFVRPLIAAENQRVRSERERLETIASRAKPSIFDQWWLDSMAEKYAVDQEELEEEAVIETLLRRVDVVPMSLALAQAAKESGWGTSRFAQDGNNLFGEWCFDAGCGLVPVQRSQGRRHEVEAFDSPRESVVSYLRNLNTHESYQSFRLERARLREVGEDPSGLALVSEISRYSERREAYIDVIRSLIRVNNLTDRPPSADDADSANADD
jgi:Bax protein